MAAKKKPAAEPPVDGYEESLRERSLEELKKRLRGMLARHVRNSVWLKAREPIMHAFIDTATDSETADAPRLRAIEKIADMLERAEDEKRRETFEGVEEGVEASLRRLEAAIRRSARDTESQL